MRAVNLVPPESRSGQFTAGKSGGAVYGVPVALLLVLLAVSGLAITGKHKKEAEQELASVQQSTQAYQQLASRFASFTDAAAKTSQRIELVRSISDARFDWAGSLRDMARVMPSTAQVLKLEASVRDGVGGSGSQFRSALPTPAIAMEGCSSTQEAVADLVTRLQAMRRVTNVTMETAKRDDDLTILSDGKYVDANAAAGGDDAAATGGSTGSGADCSFGESKVEWTIVVFYATGKSAPSDSVGASTPSPQTASATTPAAPTPAAGN